MDETTEQAAATEQPAPVISEADNRKLRKMLDKMLDSGRPMESSANGRLANDAYGHVYMRDKGKGNVRVIVADGQIIRAGHKNKVLRKAELKAVRMARKAAARKTIDGRKRAE